MNKLPQEHIIQEAPKVRDMEVDAVRWIQRAKPDHDGNLWVSKTSKTQTEKHDGPVPPRFCWKIQRLQEGWKVWVPQSSLPLEPWPRSMLEPVCFQITEIEIIDN